MMNYKRITERIYGGYTVSVNGKIYYDEVADIAQRLAELEDKIENGTLVELQCKVGDKIFEVFNYPIPQIKETAVDKVVFTAKGIRLKLARNSFYETAVSSIGKTIFFTRAEAEKKLKELKGVLNE